MSKQKIVSFLFEKNYMVSPEILKKIPDSFDYDSFLQSHKNFQKSQTTILLTEEMFQNFFPPPQTVYSPFSTKIEIVDSYVDKPKKREVKDFVGYMKCRYASLKRFLLQRTELQGAISINKALTKNQKEAVALIGFVYKKEQTKNGNYILEIEDPTGIIKVLIGNKNEELLKVMDELVLDEVIGIVGTMGDGLVYVKEIIFPDIPMKEYKKAKDDVCVAFISDLHVGSKMFAKDEFEKFIDWLNLLYGSDEQKELAQKVKYLVISGDLIDGVGIYPGQEKELSISDIYGQYDALAKYLGSLRGDIKIVLCGGNHDALRLSEPQPPLSKEFAASLYALKNITIVSNPAMVRIHDMFDILIYHGYCFDYYMNNVESLRNAGAYDASDMMMEFVLKKRHIAPTHISSLYIPDIEKDSLVIEKVPDFFVTGHIHHDVKISSYKNVTLIGSCSFQYKTAFQEKLGHTNITWGKSSIINLKTRQIKIMDFRKEEMAEIVS
ncbi:MAG: DNA polymerase II small subunit [archaeon GW2011_AR17]|nr:MAG: DNA polymerase II small subunit [archaeon GW2011_AR17]MBS3154580.1 metallophosphoesterase [Candidatus Woesearchaeota archaeon]HIH14900.1 DNA polymerase II small subunit [Nanoarchaeota archaeon]HIH58962.1 DNA polymerase II small subunit [Nanoarchaeota archaeon]HII14211.1 DNA polymerase II small subunit [Nanoarchaeota archaeon]